MKIKVTSVYVDDQSKALRFYTEVLGFAKKTDFSQGPYRWLTVASPEEPNGTELQLALNNNPAAKAYQQAMYDPAQLREWAPFDADGNLGAVGATVKLTTVGAPAPRVTETTVTRADAPELLEYKWGGFDMRWELEDLGGGTRLTLWTNIGHRFISMGAAGWHICFDVLERLLAGEPIGRIVGPEAMKFGGWQRLNAEYAKQFGIETPDWPSQKERTT